MACIRRKTRKGGGVYYEVDYYAPDNERGRVRKIERFPTRERAERRRTEVAATIAKGTYVAPAKLPTFNELADRWFAGKHGHRPASRAQWQAHLAHLRPTLGPLRLDRIDVARVEAVRDALTAKKFAPQTVNKVLTTAAAVFKLGQRHGFIERNVGALAERLRVGAGELTGHDAAHANGRVCPEDVPTTEELRKIIAETEPGRFRTYLLTAALTGARPSELLALQWGDVELPAVVRGEAPKSGRVAIRRSVSWARVKGDTEPVRARFYAPKTAAGNRVVEAPPELCTALRAWRAACPPSPQELVFPNETGGPMHRSAIIRQGLRPALRRAKLRSFDVYSLRHYFASALIAGGARITEVSHLLGHSSPLVTLRVYAHWLRDEQTSAVADLARAVCGDDTRSDPQRIATGKFLVSDELGTEAASG